MKNGLISENDELIYYKDDVPYYAGVIKIDNDIYYIGHNGHAVKGNHVIHRYSANGILKHGTYKFGDDCKLIPDTYVAPEKYSETKSKSKIKFRKVMSKKTKLNIAITSIVVLLVVFIGVIIAKSAGWIDGVKPVDTSEYETDASGSSKIQFPDFTSEVYLCSEAAAQLYNGELSIDAAILQGKPYRPFVFEYKIGKEPVSLYIGENENMTDADVYTLNPEQTSINIDNLKTGTQYYYSATADGNTYTGAFKTAVCPRFLSVPDIKNIRDIGGYTTLDGKTVKQGILIRGSEFDGLVEPSYFLQSEYIDYVKNTFGFKYDLDLREASTFTGIYKSRLGENVKHEFYSAPSYGAIFNETYKATLKHIFSDLAEPENYPMYMHCTYGADRTGTIIFLLQGILNVKEEDMKSEYTLTAFERNSIISSENLNPVYGGLEGYEGDTIQEKIVSFLTVSVGVTNEQIESIRNIYLENKTVTDK